MIARRTIATLIPRIQAPPEWGIQPVPQEHRLLGLLDYFVLWADLGVGLLVLLAGTLLVPGLGLGQAFMAIVVGSIIGCFLLSLAATVGSANNIPTMVLMRPSLGIRGSYIPSIINILQLIGWGTFEIIVMAYAANGIAERYLGFSNHLLWVTIFAAFCTALALGGPLMVVKQWLEKFAVWFVLATTVWLSYHLLTNYNIGELIGKAGSGDMTFWLGVDLVIAMPISWLPLVADYTRFARHNRGAFWGTYLGYVIANIWFYALGATMILALAADDLIAAFLAIPAAWLALMIILVDETDNTFADIYSAAVSSQNIFSSLRQRWGALAIGAICFILAATFDIRQYEHFLLLIGSVFVSLFGVLAADYFVLRRRYETQDIYRAGGQYWYWQGFHWRGILAWALGIALYQIITNFVPWLGASIPSFLLAFLAYLALAQVTRQPAPAAA